MPGRGVLPEKLGGDVRHASWNPYPISDQNPWFSLSYFRPDKKYLIPVSDLKPWSPGARRVTGARDKLLRTNTVVGVNIKREMVLSPTDKEVANSSKKIYPIQDWSAQTIPYFRPKRLKKNVPFGATHAHIAYIRDSPGGEKRVANYESRCLRKRE